ncbi:MAG: ACP S-malonyltransferase [Verrucomicrobiota bacterium]
MIQKRIALLFAGQGAQVVGMGRDLADQFPQAAELFAKADEVLSYSLSRIAWEGPEAELTQTRCCQPALYVHGLACLAALRSVVGEFPVAAAAGLSLGEFTAHAAAGTFDFETGLRLVAQRGTFMQEACESTAGGMAAMIGGEEEAVRKVAEIAGVDVANFNSPGQIVVSGEQEGVSKAVAIAKEHGIRMAKPLNVAGAYHSRLMSTAAEKLGAVLDTVEMNTPAVTLICNFRATPVSGAAEIRETLKDQVTGSVRWTQTMLHLLDEEKIDLFIELGPGGVLAGLLGRTRKGTPIVSVSDAASIEVAAAAIRA